MVGSFVCAGLKLFVVCTPSLWQQFCMRLYSVLHVDLACCRLAQYYSAVKHSIHANVFVIKLFQLYAKSWCGSSACNAVTDCNFCIACCKLTAICACTQKVMSSDLHVICVQIKEKNNEARALAEL